MDTFDKTIFNKYFLGMQFSDNREREVFLSYIRGFAVLHIDPSIKSVLEIGGGQSTALLATMANSLGWKIYTIDMNPNAVSLKIRNQLFSDSILQNIVFCRGVSVEINQVLNYYESNLQKIGGVEFAEAVKKSIDFIDVSMDGRKVSKVSEALELSDFSPKNVVAKILNHGSIPEKLLGVFKTPGNEIQYHDSSSSPPIAFLHDLMDTKNVDAVFLDSGEFSSLPEWDIVEKKLRPGGYVILHDIFFPKSFKNWLVCGSILANSAFEVIYLDRTTPQGLMIAQKKL